MMQPIKFSQQQKPVKKKEEKCRIKVRKTKTGKEVSFSGKCSKEQLSVAGQTMGDD